MASTYSPLKIELIATGEQSGTWGTTTNTNLGTAIEEAIVGSADVSFSSADVTLTLTDTNAAQIARNLRLNLTGTSGGARNLILGSGCQIEKPYLINNGLADTVTVKNTTGTGIAVPAGKSMWVYNNGTNVVDAVTHLTSLTLGSALPIASGGTGTTSTTFVNLTTNVTGDLPFANLTQIAGLSVLGVTGSTTADVAGITAASDHQVFRRSGTTVSFGAIALNQTNAITGTLPVANGGTGITSFGTGVATALGQNVSGSGSIALTTSPTFTTPVLGTPTSGTLSNCTVDGTDAVGFRNTPINSQSAAYTLVLADAGKTILHPIADDNARTFTIPANSSVAYPVGTVVTFVNLINDVTIDITTDTMYLAGDGATGSRTLAAYGVASAVKVASTTWVISGNGLT
jgi:hypothetical protein